MLRVREVAWTHFAARVEYTEWKEANWSLNVEPWSRNLEYSYSIIGLDAFPLTIKPLCVVQSERWTWHNPEAYVPLNLRMLAVISFWKRCILSISHSCSSLRIHTYLSHLYIPSPYLVAHIPLIVSNHSNFPVSCWRPTTWMQKLTGDEISWNSNQRETKIFFLPPLLSFFFFFL